MAVPTTPKPTMPVLKLGTNQPTLPLNTFKIAIIMPNRNLTDLFPHPCRRLNQSKKQTASNQYISRQFLQYFRLNPETILKIYGFFQKKIS
jgi:hypothetical protein